MHRAFAEGSMEARQLARAWGRMALSTDRLARGSGKAATTEAAMAGLRLASARATTLAEGALLPAEAALTAPRDRRAMRSCPKRLTISFRNGTGSLLRTRACTRAPATPSSASNAFAQSLASMTVKHAAASKGSKDPERSTSATCLGGSCSHAAARCFNEVKACKVSSCSFCPAAFAVASPKATRGSKPIPSKSDVSLPALATAEAPISLTTRSLSSRAKGCSMLALAAMGRVDKHTAATSGFNSLSTEAAASGVASKLSLAMSLARCSDPMRAKQSEACSLSRALRVAASAPAGSFATTARRSCGGSLARLDACRLPSSLHASARSSGPKLSSNSPLLLAADRAASKSAWSPAGSRAKNAFFPCSPSANGPAAGLTVPPPLDPATSDTALLLRSASACRDFSMRHKRSPALRMRSTWGPTTPCWSGAMVSSTALASGSSMQLKIRAWFSAFGRRLMHAAASTGAMLASTSAHVATGTRFSRAVRTFQSPTPANSSAAAAGPEAAPAKAASRPEAKAEAAAALEAWWSSLANAFTAQAAWSGGRALKALTRCSSVLPEPEPSTLRRWRRSSALVTASRACTSILSCHKPRSLSPDSSSSKYAASSPVKQSSARAPSPAVMRFRAVMAMATLFSPSRSLIWLANALEISLLTA
mmetsp:Transcript_10293/g.18873  ORF Transcript_10293/g.18873 Transcript_10293/m.18873 type:complete len:652 (-) Transcript_10293:507-2462(-)